MSSGLQLGEVPPQAPPRPASLTRRRKKVSKWDRPAPPKDWRYFVGGFGKVLIALGLLTFGFVAYQLWGTGIETRAAQNELADQFELNFTPEATATIPEVTATIPTAAAPTIDPEDPEIDYVASAEEQAALLTPPSGAIMKMEIPKIDLEYYVVPGVGREDLKRGIGHFDQTPWAGQLGNAAFAGHRTTYGGPFYHLDKLNPGDRIYVTRKDGNKYSYEVTSSEVVLPENVAVLDGDPRQATIMLQTCTPVHSASHRLIIHGTLVPEESAVVGVPTFYNLASSTDDGSDDQSVTETLQSTTTEAVTDTTIAGEFVPRSTEAPDTVAPTTQPTPQTTVLDSEGLADEAAGVDSADGAVDEDSWETGWFEDRDAIPLVVMWGALLLALYIASRMIARWTRHDSVGILVAAAPFLYCLYFFYENVNRLLPAGI